MLIHGTALNRGACCVFLLFLPISPHLQSMGKNHVNHQDGVIFWNCNNCTKSLLSSAWMWPFCKAWMNSRARSICHSFRDVKWVCRGSAQAVQASVSNCPWTSPVAKQSPSSEPKEQPPPLTHCLSCGGFTLNEALDLQVTRVVRRTSYELAWLQRESSSMGIIAVDQQHLGDARPTDNIIGMSACFQQRPRVTFFPLFPVNAWYNYYCPQIMNISPSF